VKTNYTKNGPLEKFFEEDYREDVSENKLILGAKYINSFENPSFNIYSIGPMMRDVLGFSRRESKMAFLYWVALNEEEKFVEENL
jgi:hypothetical protein